jgi:hypothetical protein
MAHAQLMLRKYLGLKKCTVTIDERSGKPSRGDLRTHQSRLVTARVRSDRSVLCLLSIDGEFDAIE